MDYRKELERVREEMKGISKPYDNEALELIAEGMYGTVLVAEQNLSEQNNCWENSALVREFLGYASILEGYDHLLNAIYSATKRMAETIYDHPRLKVQFLQFFRKVIFRIEAQQGHELSIGEDIAEEISELEYNIYFADKCEYDQIKQSGHLKHDPIEWSARWEEVIDEADKITYSILADHPRGMGFCHAYWHTRASILHEQFGIEWRSPSAMNPRVMFD